MKKIISLVILLSMAITSIGVVSAYSGNNDAKVTSNYRIGDVNKDGKINIKDVAYIQRKIVNNEDFSAEELTLADVNKDGRVTVADATLIQKSCVKRISSFPSIRQDETASTTTSTTKPSTVTLPTTTKPTLTTDPDGYFDIVVKPWERTFWVMKEVYSKIEIEIEEINNDDVITTSTPSPDKPAEESVRENMYSWFFDLM